MTLIGFSVAFLLTMVGGWMADRTDILDMALTPSQVFMVLALAALGRSQCYPDYE